MQTCVACCWHLGWWQCIYFRRLETVLWLYGNFGLYLLFEPFCTKWWRGDLKQFTCVAYVLVHYFPIELSPTKWFFSDWDFHSFVMASFPNWMTIKKNLFLPCTFFQCPETCPVGPHTMEWGSGNAHLTWNNDMSHLNCWISN